MESLSNTTKRKKRKTRKCLDEIRKRSRRTGQIMFEKKNDKVCKLVCNYNSIDNCLITSNRLTLTMFPNAVRSETITRPALADLKQKSDMNLNDLVKSIETTKSSTKSNLPKFMNIFDNDIEHFKDENLKLISNKCALGVPDYYEESVEKNTNIQEKLSVNLDLFSSVDSAEVIDKSPDSIGAQSVSTLTSSNQSVHDDYGYNLYEEFMSEIPKYLKQNTTLIEEDVMKKTKVFLQKLFIENCYQECQDNVLKCIKNSSKKKYYSTGEVIVHNPIDYIRLSHVQQQSLFQQSSKKEETIEECLSNPHSPRAPSSPAASPNTPLSVVVNDSPDYIYYPHRLN